MCSPWPEEEKTKKGEVKSESDGRGDGAEEGGGEGRGKSSGSELCFLGSRLGPQGRAPQERSSIEYLGVLWEMVCEPQGAPGHLGVRILRGEGLRTPGVFI